MTNTEFQLPKVAQTRISRLALASGRSPAAILRFVLRDGFAPSKQLGADIQDYVRTRLSAHEYPRRVDFVDELPMTTTGKIIRRLLRERE